jgi:hypothetical protein
MASIASVASRYRRGYLPRNRARVSLSRALPRAFAARAILPLAAYGLVAYSSDRPPTRASPAVPSFRWRVLRWGRSVLSAGFRGGADQSLAKMLAPILDHFGPGHQNSRGPVHVDDGSHGPSLALTIPTGWRRHAVEFDAWPRCSPLQGLRTSRYPGGTAFPHCTVRAGNHARHRATSCQCSLHCCPSPGSRQL